MKLAVSLVALSAASLASAHRDVHARHQAYIQRRDEVLGRQVAAAAAATATATSSVAASSPAASTAVASGAGSQTVTASVAAVTTPTVDGSAIPALSAITSGAPIETPLSMFTTFTAGASAPYSGAPALPTIAIVGTNYPALDTIPAVDSPQVLQWLSEIDLSGVPNLGQTVDGSCASNPAFAADTTRCWWTCGGCTRSTDIVACPDKLDWGVSYDDGPSPYTPKLVNFLHQKNITATFFIVGSRAISRPDMLQTEYMLGHEISVHTWSHPPLTTLTNEQIVAELGWTRQAIKDIIGVSPRTMRPPYGDIDDRVRAVCKAMGLTPVIWTSSGQTDFDTDDWKIPGGTATGTSAFAAWEQIETLATTIDTGFIVLEHDLYQQSVDLAVGYVLPNALNHTPAFTLSSVIECLHEPASNTYAELFKNGTTTGNGTTASSAAGSSSTGGAGSSTTKSGAASSRNMSLFSGLAGAAFVVGAAFMW